MSDGLWANIHAKRKRIKAGSGEKMRTPGSEGAPTDAAIARSQKTSKKKKKTPVSVAAYKKIPMMGMLEKRGMA
tara:strand:+ start:984 stop:1205 length:222 start_codon:yes stop_codon:yes gene_type:complete